jgi:hypothetical protein
MPPHLYDLVEDLSELKKRMNAKMSFFKKGHWTHEIKKQR